MKNYNVKKILIDNCNGAIAITSMLHLVSFNPKTGDFTDHGSVNPDRELCYFHGIAILDDGTIYVGETDSFIPEVYKLTPM